MNALNSQIEKNAKEYIDANTIVTPPNLVDIIRNAVSYKWSTYTIKNTYTLDSVNNTRVFPVIASVDIFLKNWQKYAYSNKANNQTELNALNSQIEKNAKEYIDANTIASNFKSPIYDFYARYLEEWNTINKISSLTWLKLNSILPFSSAHADILPGWWIKVQSWRTQLPPFTPYDSTTVKGKFLWNSGLVDHYVKNTKGKVSVAGNNQDQTELRSVISQIQFSVDKIKEIRAQCSGVGTTLPSPTSNWCIENDPKIQQEESKIKKAISQYLYYIGEAIYPSVASTANYMYWLWDGAITSIYAMASLWSDILDWDAIKKVGDWYTTKMYPYFYENGFDFMKYWWDESRFVLWLEASIWNLIQEVIWLETDPYRRWYLIGSIWATVGVGKILGTAANAAVTRMKWLGQLVATVESMPVSAKRTQLLNILKAKMVQEVVVKFNNINTVEDIQAIAKVNTLPELTQKAYIVIGTEETAQGVVNFLKNKNWKLDPTPDKNVVTYTSPDWLQRVNFRIDANSVVPGYQTRVTFDLLRKVGNQFKAISWGDEVKFVFPNK